jgi:hypothetical protein
VTAAAIARVVVLATVTVCVGCAHPDRAGRMAVWQLRGTVVSVDAGGLLVRHKSGQRVAVEIDAETAWLRGDRPVPATAVQAGARVIIEVEPLGGGRQRARRVHLAPGV